MFYCLELFVFQKAFSYSLIRYDTEKEEPVKDSRGFCIEVPTGEQGFSKNMALS